MSLSSAVMRAVGVGLPPSGRLRKAYLAVWELGELQGKGARRGSRPCPVWCLVRIQAYAIMGASTQGWWPFVNNEHR